MTLDDEGHVTHGVTVSAYPPAILVDAVRRTTALLRGGTFALRSGKITSGQQRLRLRATVDTAREQAVGGGLAQVGFGEDNGLAYGTFTQGTGRRVKITVETVRVKTATGP